MTQAQHPDQRDETSGGDPDRSAARDRASEPGLGGTAARYPLWLIIGGVLIFALVALYLASIAVPAGP